MKKHTVIFPALMAVLLLLAAVFVAGCAKDKPKEDQSAAVFTPEPSELEATDTPAPTDTPEPDSPYTVLTVRSDSYGGIPYRVDVNITETETVDKSKEGTRKTIEFAGRKFELEYQKTVTEVVGGYTLDVYKHLGAPQASCNLVLWPDDTVYALRTQTITLDLDENASADEVRALLEEEFKDEIDFSAFHSIIATAPSDHDPYEYYNYYDILWYNDINGIHGLFDSVLISVHKNGTISLMYRSYTIRDHIDAMPEEVPDDISLEGCIPAIEAKLDEIYGDSLTGYRLGEWPTLTLYEGKLCIDYYVHSNFKSPIMDDDGALLRLLIMVDPAANT